MTRYVGAVILALSLAHPAAADQFTAAQKAEIVQIVRDALKKDPAILREAVDALQAEETRQQREASRSAIAASRERN